MRLGLGRMRRSHWRIPGSNCLGSDAKKIEADVHVASRARPFTYLGYPESRPVSLCESIVVHLFDRLRKKRKGVDAGSWSDSGYHRVAFRSLGVSYRPCGDGVLVASDAMFGAKRHKSVDPVVILRIRHLFSNRLLLF